MASLPPTPQCTRERGLTKAPFTQSPLSSSRRTGLAFVNVWGADGIPDMVACSSTGSVFVAQGNSDGTFASVTFGTLGGASNANLILAVDVTGDGWDDIVSSGSSSIHVQRNQNGNGLGGFSSPDTVQVVGTGGATALASADVDNDSDLDIVFATSAIYYVLNANALGTSWSAPVLVTTPLNEVVNVFAEDYNQDGFVDMVYLEGGFSGTSFGFIPGTAPGVFGVGSAAFPPSAGYKSVALHMADLDGDSRKDALIVYGSLFGAPMGLFGISWVRNTGPGMTGPLISLKSEVQDSGGLDMTNLNKNSHQDIVITMEATQGCEFKCLRGK